MKLFCAREIWFYILYKQNVEWVSFTIVLVLTGDETMALRRTSFEPAVEQCNKIQNCIVKETRLIQLNIICKTRLTQSLQWLGCGLGDRRIAVWYPILLRDFPFFTAPRLTLGHTLSAVCGGSESERLERLTDYSLPSNDEVKSEWSCATAPPYASILWILI